MDYIQHHLFMLTSIKPLALPYDYVQTWTTYSIQSAVCSEIISHARTHLPLPVILLLIRVYIYVIWFHITHASLMISCSLPKIAKEPWVCPERKILAVNWSCFFPKRTWAYRYLHPRCITKKDDIENPFSGKEILINYYKSTFSL